ncbi:MAG: hypothetical protein JWR16_728 [Nevskia sp.]|nr:hypothetical protein [Nevskia sp.]
MTESSSLSQFPQSVSDLTPQLLTALIAPRHPGAVVQSFEVLKSSQYGEAMVSTSARALLSLQYAPGTGNGLPQRAILKLPREISQIIAAIYVNEVRLYMQLGAEIGIETPRVLGGVCDPATGHYGLLLEDLTLRDARFPNVTQEITLDQIEMLVDTLAQLHARYWQSPRFSGDLAWLESHVEGPVCRLMNDVVPMIIQQEIDINPFKRELVQKLRTTGSQLLLGTQAVQRHQGKLPQTLLHGDTHLGNTYLLPDGRVGLLDWQLTVRGHCAHDLSYLITTALTVEMRRRHEHELLQRYLDRLAAFGVAQPPTFGQLWTEYRRALVWGVYIGWLTTPVVNYGWEINIINLLRLTTAYEDLETAKLVAQVI